MTLTVGVRPAGGQDLPRGIQLADRGPVFYAPADARGARTVRVDAGSVAVLRQRIAIELRGATIPEALAAIGDRSGLRFAYDQSTLATSARVTLVAEDLTVAAALTQVLLDSHVDVEIGLGGLVSLFPRGAPRGAAETGALIGHVTDSKTGQRVPFATIVLEGANRRVTASDSGTYRLGNLAAGSYTLLGRALGYSPRRVSASVVAGQATEVDLALDKSANPLDRVVVTGTVVPTEVKALPTPVTVITEDEIDQPYVRRTDAVFRQAVPSAVAPDNGMYPEETTMSVRGATTLVGGASTVKVYLDGIEISDQDFAAIDPTSIERIEVIRGPEASAIYGSNAIGGVLQVFTKRGDSLSTRPHVDLQASGGVVQSQFEHGAPRQQYQGSISGGSPTASYNLGGSYGQTGAWVPQYSLSSPSLYGGLKWSQGPISVDLLGRYYQQDYDPAADPRGAATGFSVYAKPFYRRYESDEQTYGVHLAYAPVSWWQTNITTGLDRFFTDEHSFRARFTTPDDSLLLVSIGDETKTSVAFNSSATASLARRLSATMTVGVDHYEFDNNGFETFGATNASGAINTDPAQPVQGERDITTNTGYFGQAQLNIAETVFLTAGLRAEQNSDFGADLGVPLSPRAGISIVRTFGGLTIKLRGSYGRAIQPPEPGEKDFSTNPFAETLANPNLGPQRQTGGDGGFDLAFGGRGSLGVTYFNQTANDLITSVLLEPDSSPQVFQFQNVGSVKNTGVEVEGTLRVASTVQFRAQFAYARSRVDDLGPNYTGDQLVGDQVFQIPLHTGGASVIVTPLRHTSVTAGLTYVGSRQYYDFLAEFRCIAGTGPCQSTSRGYIITYGAITKVNLAVTQRLTPLVSAFVSVENLTNTDVDEVANVFPVPGRITMAGLRMHY